MRNLHSEFAIMLLLKITEKGQYYNVEVGKLENDVPERRRCYCSYILGTYRRDMHMLVQMLRRNRLSCDYGRFMPESRSNFKSYWKDKLENFQTYHESLLDWLKIAMNINSDLCIIRGRTWRFDFIKFT